MKREIQPKRFRRATSISFASQGSYFLLAGSGRVEAAQLLDKMRGHPVPGLPSIGCLLRYSNKGKQIANEQLSEASNIQLLVLVLLSE